jgi:hypothetical protein
MKKLTGKLLNYIYLKKFNEDTIPQFNELLEVSEFEPHQLKMILDYCERNNFLKFKKVLSGEYIGIKILPDAFDLISDEDNFKRTFGIGVNLGLVNFNWGVSEK